MPGVNLSLCQGWVVLTKKLFTTLERAAEVVAMSSRDSFRAYVKEGKCGTGYPMSWKEFRAFLDTVLNIGLGQLMPR